MGKAGLYGVECPQAPAGSSHSNSHVDCEGAGGTEGIDLGVEGYAGIVSRLLGSVSPLHTEFSQ